MRTRILGMLDERVASPRQLSDELDAPLQNVSYHVRELAKLNLIKLVRTTQRRGAIEHHYTAIAAPHVSDAAWSELPPNGSVEYWSEATMLAPRSNRKDETAATIPARSGHETTRRASTRSASASGCGSSGRRARSAASGGGPSASRRERPRCRSAA